MIIERNKEYFYPKLHLLFIAFPVIGSSGSRIQKPSRHPIIIPPICPLLSTLSLANPNKRLIKIKNITKQSIILLFYGSIL